MLIPLKCNKKLDKGFSIIEILISVFIIVIVFINFLGIIAFSLKSANFIKKTNEANFLAQEGIETVRSFRDATDWDIDGLGTLSTDVDYCPSLTIAAPPAWTMVLGAENIDIFNRKIVFQKVSRDPITNGIEPVYNAFNDDPDTRKTVVTVSFGSKLVELTTYFTNWQE